MHCVNNQTDQIIFEGCYLQEDIFSYIQRGNPVTLKNRKMSTYINTLAKAGLMVEQLVEETSNETLARPAEFTSGYYTPYKAKKFPLSFIMKAKKIASSSEHNVH